MSASPQRRRLWFLVPDADGTSILVDGDDHLPHVEVALGDGESTAMAATRVALDRWGLPLPVTELLFDLESGDDQDDRADDETLDALLELAPAPAGWEPADGVAWATVDTTRPRVTAGLELRLGELLAERRNERPMDARRARWSRPGWHAAATGWIEEALGAAGWGRVARVDQMRHWGISAVLRVEAEGGIAWFKAVFPGFDQEPAITALLDRQVPGLVAPVLAVDEKQGWLLLADVGSTFFSGELGNSAPAIERLVAVQRQFIGRRDELRAAGCPDRRLVGLAPALDAVLRDPDVLAWIAVEPAHVPELVAWVDDAARVIDELGIPDTLVHGDFHPGNVALVDGRAVIIDWSDGAVSNPFVDVLTWIDWTKDDALLTESVWETFLQAWAGTVDVEAFRRCREVFAGVGAAYHTVSYAGIIAGLEPSHCPQHVDGLQGYFRLLQSAAASTAPRRV